MQGCSTDISATKYTHYISIDFGTYGCAIAIGFSNPKPEKIFVFSEWDRTTAGIQTKYPTVLLADPQGAFVSFGDEAISAFNKLKGQEHQDYYLFHRFKMNLYDSPVRHACRRRCRTKENVCMLFYCAQSSQPISNPQCDKYAHWHTNA